MMTEETIAALKKDCNDGGYAGNNPEHSTLLAHGKRLVRMSRVTMSKYYPEWDRNDRIFKGEIIPDVDDKKQEVRGTPEKLIVPNTYAQCMTFASFLFLMFNQNQRFYELSPNGDQDYGTLSDDCEKTLERDLRHNEWNTKLFQFLLDLPRFGIAVAQTDWTTQKAYAQVAPPPLTIELNGQTQTIELPPAWQQFTKFEGNLIRNVSPYRFFPDTRLPLTDWQRGEFCAYEEEYTISQLRTMESNGEVAGVDHIQPLPRNYVDVLGGPIVGALRTDDKQVFQFDVNNRASIALVTKMVVKIVPNKFEWGPDKKKLGEEDFEVFYILWYANNNRVIRFEQANAWHNEFPFAVSQFTPDMNHTIGTSLAALIEPLQNVISWYVNSHIKSVRRVIANRLIVDPKVIDTKSLDGDGDIYLRKGMSVPLDRAVGQLKTQDVTAGHMQDADIVSKIIETVTGVNGNAMGQYNSGRRSAQEARVVTAGAAGRMKMHAQLIWESGLGRQGRLMLSNLRQALSYESFLRIIGKNITGGEQEAQQRYAAFQGTPEEIICGDAFFMFDSTLASEKGFIAQSLQELLVAIMGNPMAGQQLDISAKALLEEIQLLRGAGSPGRFSLSKRVQAGMEQPQMPIQPPGAPQVPAGPQPSPAAGPITVAPQLHIH